MRPSATQKGRTDRDSTTSGRFVTIDTFAVRLSNQDLTTLLERLTSRDWKSANRRHPLAGGVTPDGRRKSGTVRDAIVAVLKQPGCEMRVRDIHAGVEKMLGESLSTSSVKAYLRRGSLCRVPRFEYCGKRGYRLRR